MKSALFGLFAIGGWLVVSCFSSAIAYSLLSPWDGALRPYPVPATLLVGAISCAFPWLWLVITLTWARRQ